MSTTLLPDAERVLDIGVRRAVDCLRAGGTHDDAVRILIVAGAAASLIQTEAERLE